MDEPAIPTDSDGVARLRLTKNDAEITPGESGVINPLVKCAELIRINAGYVLCEPHTPDYSWLLVKRFQTRELLQHGIVMPNSCGSAEALQKPGQIVIFVRPLSWLEKLKQ